MMGAKLAYMCEPEPMPALPAKVVGRLGYKSPFWLVVDPSELALLHAWGDIKAKKNNTFVLVLDKEKKLKS